MEKYSDDKGVGSEATVVSGPNKGKAGIVKEAKDGTMSLGLPNGEFLVIDEDQVALKKA